MKCLRAEVCLVSPDGVHCPDPRAGRLRHDSDCHRLTPSRAADLIYPDEHETGQSPPACG